MRISKAEFCDYFQSKENVDNLAWKLGNYLNYKGSFTRCGSGAARVFAAAAAAYTAA